MSDESKSAARWVRAALQVNPFTYEGASGPAKHFNDETAYNTAILERCEAEGIEMIAIADHWCVDSATGLAEAATERGIAVLPGFEANTSEGIHLLVIFDLATPFSDINAAIGHCGSDITPGCPSGTAGDSYEDIVSNMSDRNALVIPAHANVTPRGMLMVLRGQPLAKMVKHEGLHAIAVTPGIDPAPNQEHVFAGRPPFERPHGLAMIHADDISHPDRLGQVGGSTWFKMSLAGLSGLKHAVRTPDTRISLEDPSSRPRVLFKSLSWTGGFLDGETVRFADDLTALIGGRGTGKSTVIESLRYVLDVEPIGEGARRDHSAVVSEVLERGTIVELILEAVSPAAGRYILRRTVPDPAVVLDSSDSVTELKPLDVTESVEIFGQHELAEVAEQPSNVASLISRFSEEPVPVTLGELQARLRDNRTRLSEVEQEQDRLEEELADIPRLQSTAAQFDGADWPSRLAEQRRLTQDQAVVREALTRVDDVASGVAEMAEMDLVGTLRETYESLAESPEVDLLRDAEASTTELADAMETALNAISAAIAVARERLDGVQARLSAKSEPKRAEHAEVVRQLKAEGHDPERLIATQEQLARLLARSSQREVLRRRHEALLTTRKSLLDELEAAETEIRRHLGRAVTVANRATKGTVMAKPIASPDRAQLISIVGDHVANRRRALLEILQQDDFSPRQFVQAARANGLKDAYSITDAQLAAIASAGEPFLRELEETVVDRAVEVSLNVADDGQPAVYRTLETLSKGQRATALLLLLLGVSESPLVIDQPEDDLDNRFIYSGVVRYLRDLKGQRQIIVSTHNANIPVLGDAELVVTLEGDGQRGQVDQELTGSLDEPQVMRTAEDILEGGHKAFDTRRHLYGF